MPLGTAPGYGDSAYKEKVATPANFMSPSDYAYVAEFMGDSDKNLYPVYGNGLITGFFEKMGAVRYTNAQVSRWAEETRVGILISDVTRASNTLTTPAAHKLRPGQNLLISDGSIIMQARISAVPSETTITIESFLAAGWGSLGTTALTISDVPGNDFPKGSKGFTDGLIPNHTVKTNTKRIVYGGDKITKTDATEHLWFEIPSGIIPGYGGGWKWMFAHLKKGYTKFLNDREAAGLLGLEAEVGSAVAVAGLGKMKGLLTQISTGGVDWTGFPTTKAEWREVLAVFDQQGGNADYAAFLNTASYGATQDVIQTQTEIGYGMFQNGKNMAYSMDFRGFDMSGYNFYLTKSKFLNDGAGMGALTGTGKVLGFAVPVGKTTVYEEDQSVAVPFVHVDTTRGAKGEDRYLQVDPNAAENGADWYEWKYLSEFNVKAVGANNGVIFKQ